MRSSTRIDAHPSPAAKVLSRLDSQRALAKAVKTEHNFISSGFAIRTLIAIFCLADADSGVVGSLCRDVTTSYEKRRRAKPTKPYHAGGIPFAILSDSLCMKPTISSSGAVRLRISFWHRRHWWTIIHPFLACWSIRIGFISPRHRDFRSPGPASSTCLEYRHLGQ